MAKIYGINFRYQNNRIMKYFNQLEKDKYLRNYELGMRGKKLLKEEKIEINYSYTNLKIDKSKILDIYTKLKNN